MRVKVAKVVFFEDPATSDFGVTHVGPHLSFHFKLDLCNQLDLTAYKVCVNENHYILVHLYFYFYAPFRKAPSLGWK